MAGQGANVVGDAVSTYRLSTRGAVAFTGENFWAPIEKALGNPWTPENPDGTIVMRLAENSLMHDDISEYIRQNVPLSVERIQHLTYGQGPRGSTRLRKAVASFLNAEFGSLKPVNFEQIIVMSGVTGIIDAVAWSICNEGDGILIPQPFYTGYQIDINQRAHGELLPVPFQNVPGCETLDDVFKPDVMRHALERQLSLAKARGIRAVSVLLTNPHNPLGRCYPKEAILETARFCAANNLHLVSNEIYAKSVFDAKRPGIPAFSSILSLDLEGIIDPTLVHVVYGASKDFCANGLRLGILQTRNVGLLESVARLAPFSWTPYLVQDLWASMLEDANFRASFFEKSCRLAAENYTIATRFLEEHGIPYYTGSNAGPFLWIDLRRYVLGDGADSGVLRRSEDTSAAYEKREAAIDDACMRYGVSLSCGSIFFTEELGWFRLTFTLSKEELHLGLRRLVGALSDVETNGWAEMLEGFQGMHLVPDVESSSV